MDVRPAVRGVARPGRAPVAVALCAVAALLTYVILASPSTGHAGGPSGATHGRPGAPPPAPVLPRPAPHPTLGISAPTTDDLDRFISATGTHPEVFDTFEAWSLGRPLQRGIADTVAARGATLSITWEPWDQTGSATDQPRYSLASIIAGDHDAYIDMYASSVKSYPHPVTIRLMHEMNGSWYPWGNAVNGNRPGEFVRAWQHVHDRFSALGVPNVTWMWAPNAVYLGGAPLAPLYPGDAYVDAVGVSNYNWGDRAHDGRGTRWSSFDELFDPSITELRSLTGRPVWITEVASSNSGGSKAGWLAALLRELQGRPEIAGVIWFDHVDDDRGVDWRLETETAAADAWRRGFDSRRVPEKNGGRTE